MQKKILIKFSHVHQNHATKRLISLLKFIVTFSNTHAYLEHIFNHELAKM